MVYNLLVPSIHNTRSFRVSTTGYGIFCWNFYTLRFVPLFIVIVIIFRLFFSRITSSFWEYDLSVYYLRVETCARAKLVKKKKLIRLRKRRANKTDGIGRVEGSRRWEVKFRDICIFWWIYVHSNNLYGRARFKIHSELLFSPGMKVYGRACKTNQPRWIFISR